MHGERAAAASVTALLLFAGHPVYGTSLELHAEVHGAEIESARVRKGGGPWRAFAWDDLERTPVVPGRYQVRLNVEAEGGGASLQLPQCSGREVVAVDGRDTYPPPGPIVVPLARGTHDIVVAVTVTDYEGHIACGERPRLGVAVDTLEGLGTITFPSPRSARGGGVAVVYVPPHHDVRVPGPLLVGLHPWNGSIWTYAASAPLLREARERDLLLLMPSGLGNSLYTADAEDEVMRAIGAISDVAAVDARAVSLWGASMGGAGATTIGFHHPDRFAGVTSFFGDSKYDVSTYVRSILPNDAAAHLVNALDVFENARNLRVWLIHGEADRTSPVRQSEILATRMREGGLSVRFDRVPGAGHSAALVARFLPEVVAAATSIRAPEHVTRVTYRSVRPSDTHAYGVRIVRTALGGDAFVDVERRSDGVHVLHARGVRRIVLSRGSLGATTEGTLPIFVDDAGGGVLDALWEP